MTHYLGTNGRLAVLLPGRTYTPDHPLLYYARAVLLHQGWSVEEVWWNQEDLVSDAALLARIEEVLDKASDKTPLVVAKSLGSLALPSVVKRGWSGIWLTPLLNRVEIVAAVKDIRAKSLLVGGMDDESWNGDVAKSIGQQVLEISGADHGLEIPGDPSASVRVLGEIVATIGTFAANL